MAGFVGTSASPGPSGPGSVSFAGSGSLRPGRVDWCPRSALFNRALSLSHLFLDTAAAVAWQHYLKVATGADWRTEAQERLAALAPPLLEDWDEVRKDFPATLLDQNTDSLQRLVERFPQEFWEYTEQELPVVWAAQVTAANTTASIPANITASTDEPALLRLLADLAAALERTTGDPHLAQMVAALQTTPQTLVLARAHQRFAAAHEAYGQQSYGRAMEMFQEAEESLRSAGSPLHPWARFYRSVCIYFLEDLERALEELETLREEFTDSGYTHLLAFCDWMIGLIQVSEGQFGDGINNYRAAVGLFETNRMVGRENFLRSLLVDALRRLGEPEGAWEYLHPTLAHTRSVRSPRHRKVSYEIAAEVLAALGHPQVALHYLAAALESAHQTGKASSIAETLYVRAQTHHQGGQEEKALGDLQEARRWMAAIEEPAAARRIEAGISRVEGNLTGSRPEQSLDRLTSAIEYFEQTSAEVFLPELLLHRARRFLHDEDPAAAEDDPIISFGTVVPLSREESTQLLHEFQESLPEGAASGLTATSLKGVHIKTDRGILKIPNPDTNLAITGQDAVIIHVDFTAAAVGPRALLTAAHAVKDDLMQIQIRGNQACCDLHPDFKNGDRSADYALCYMEEDLRRREYGTVNQDPMLVEQLQEILLSGYGGECHATTFSDAGHLDFKCAEVDSWPQDGGNYLKVKWNLCNGDSGGPGLAHCKPPANRLIVGVNSQAPNGVVHLSSASSDAAVSWFGAWARGEANGQKCGTGKTIKICGVNFNGELCNP